MRRDSTRKRGNGPACVFPQLRVPVCGKGRHWDSTRFETIYITVHERAWRAKSWCVCSTSREQARIRWASRHRRQRRTRRQKRKYAIYPRLPYVHSVHYAGAWRAWRYITFNGAPMDKIFSGG